MPRGTESLRVLAGRVPFIPLSVRNVAHVSIEEFMAAEAGGEWVGRVDQDDMTILYFATGSLVHSKIGGVVMKHWLEPHSMKVHQPKKA